MTTILTFWSRNQVSVLRLLILNRLGYGVILTEFEGVGLGISRDREDVSL